MGVTGQRVDVRADARLVEAARAGDRSAFAELIVRHRGTALAVSSRLLGSMDLAGDAVQEASLLAMTSLDRLRSPERFGAWLCGIALNVARRWLREVRCSALPPDAALADGAASPDEQVEAEQMAADVRRAVAALADGQRDAVLLFYLQGLSHREVAAELAISVGAVKARLHQARAALRPTLVPLIETEERTVMSEPEAREWIDVSVREVRRDSGDDPTSRRQVVVLSERDGDAELPIWVGPFEATAVALSLQATEMPRPMTYQFASNLVSATGGRVVEVRITGLTEGVFYATVVVEGPASAGEVDARPSDALNLALVTGSPIRVDRRLLEEPEATERTEWRGYRTTTADIVAEVQQHDRDVAEAATARRADSPQTNL
jgi:RNA polymerase sigma factor (sigma-70 family)